MILHPDRLESGSTLGAERRLVSRLGDYALILRTEGYLSLCRTYAASLPVELWSTPTGDGRRNPELNMQNDGNLCLVTSGGTVWETGTSGNEGAYLILKDDGNVDVVSRNNEVLWSSETAGKSEPDMSVPTWPGSEAPAQGTTPADVIGAIDFNMTLKSVVTKGLSLVPEAGALLSGLVSFLWPDTEKPGLMWEEISKGVKVIVRDMLDEDKAKDLQLETLGLYEAVQGYATTSYRSRQKGQKLTAILLWFTTTKWKYLDNETPWKTLQYFVPMATLHLTFLREQYFNWDKVYPTDAGVDKERCKKELDEAIAQYLDAAKRIQNECLVWRLDNRIVKTDWEELGAGFGGQKKRCWVRDDETGFEFKIECNYNNNYGGSMGYDPDLMVERVRQQCRDSVDAVYRQQINDLLSPSLQWDQFNQNKRYYRTVLRETLMRTTGTMGRGINAHMTHFNDREFAEEHGPITKIILYAWDSVDGFEIWYGNKSRLHGDKGGTPRVLELADEGESIVCVSGRMGDRLDSIRFYVSADKSISGGGMGRGGAPNVEDNFRIGHLANGPSEEPETFKLKYAYGWATPARNGQPGHIEQLGLTFFKTGEE